MAKWRMQVEPVSTEIIPGKKYTNTELNAIADAILKEDARCEMCRECGKKGTETGNSQREMQPLEDGGALLVEFKEYACDTKHKWYQGEGSVRGIGGENPILFEEHIIQRKRREIFCTDGIPDPNIVSGIYNRSHPQGRKINSEEQRKKNGASWYR